MSPALQFLTLIGLFLFIWIAGNFFGGIFVWSRYGRAVLEAISADKLSEPHSLTAVWILQFFGTTLPLLITPIIFSYLIVKDQNDYLKNHFHFPVMLIILVFAVMFSAMPLFEFLGNLNLKIPLAKWMVDYEESLSNIQRAMMDMRSFWDMMFNLIFIGLLTAIVEETFFRGCIQTIFLRWTKNTHAAIWITAILFSAFHMEFSGFIPRMFLGILFGYFVVWSGSIWPAVLAHFINNGTIVVWEYLYQNKMTRFNPDVQQMFTNVGYIIGFLLTLLLLVIYWYISSKWHAAHHGEELD